MSSFINSFFLVADPYFSNVSLLLHLDGADTSTTFTDKSSFARTATLSVTPKISTAQSVFGGASGLFAGQESNNCDGLLFSGNLDTGFNFGSGAFTIEGRFRLTGYKSDGYCAVYAKNRPVIAGSGGIGMTFYIVGTASSWTSGFIDFFDDTSTLRRQSFTYAFSLNTWYSFGVSRSGNTLSLYINNAVVFSVAFTYTIITNTNYFSIGASNPGFAGYGLPGYIDEFRVTKGIARDLTIAQTVPFPNT